MLRCVQNGRFLPRNRVVAQRCGNRGSFRKALLYPTELRAQRPDRLDARRWDAGDEGCYHEPARQATAGRWVSAENGTRKTGQVHYSIVDGTTVD